MTPSVAILLSTFNGARFLADQLASFERQTHENWLLVAADDMSTDETSSILKDFQRRRGCKQVKLQTGPARGHVANFLSLACNSTIKADFYAFSDQDDIWEDDKLSRALGWLRTVPRQTPAVYASRTRLIDQDGRYIGLSPLFHRPPAFANALVQNILAGNTMVFNEPARQLLISAGLVNVQGHDWWLYLLTTANGGMVQYDPWCSVRYRGHEGNLIGLNIGMQARLRRARMLIRGRFKQWTDMNLAALAGVRQHMTPDNLSILDQFSEARRKPILSRLLSARRSGVHRQSTIGNIGLFIGLCLNKI